MPTEGALGHSWPTSVHGACDVHRPVSKGLPKAGTALLGKTGGGGIRTHGCAWRASVCTRPDPPRADLPCASSRSSRPWQHLPCSCCVAAGAERCWPLHSPSHSCLLFGVVLGHRSRHRPGKIAGGAIVVLGLHLVRDHEDSKADPQADGDAQLRGVLFEQGRKVEAWGE